MISINTNPKKALAFVEGQTNEGSLQDKANRPALRSFI